MANPHLVDFGPATSEQERVRVESLNDLVSRLKEAMRYDLDRQEFSLLVRRSRRILELDQYDVSRAFKISRPTVSRWESGESAPHPIGRKPVLQVLRKLAMGKLRQHDTK